MNKDLSRADEEEEAPDFVTPEIDKDKDPPPARAAMRQIMAMFSSATSGRAYHPVFDKFEPSHVDKFLDHAHEEDMERLRQRKSGRWFRFAYSALFVLATAWLVSSLLPEHKDLLSDIIKVALGFAGGFGGGYALRSYQG